jgi:hypothetical protein
MARVRGTRRFSSSFGGVLGGIGSLAFFAFWFGVLVLGLVGEVKDLVSTMQLRDRGIHVTGVALATRSEEWTDSDGEPHRASYTKVGFTAGAVRHVEEITGGHTVGEKVPIVYDPRNPHVVAGESESGTGGLVRHWFGIAFIVGMILFGLGLMRSWYGFGRW